MPYAQKSRMIDLFGEENLILLTGGDGAIDDDKLDAAMAAADDEVNGYIGGVMPLPLTSVPEPIRLHACNIAYWYLDPDNPTDGARERYRAAERYLVRVQRDHGAFGLDSDGDAVTQPGGVTVEAPERVFSDDKLDGFTQL